MNIRMLQTYLIGAGLAEFIFGLAQHDTVYATLSVALFAAAIALGSLRPPPSV